MEEKLKQILVPMSHEEYMNYLNSGEIMGKLLDEINRLNEDKSQTIHVNGFLNIEDNEDILSKIKFTLTGTRQEDILNAIKETFRAEARIEKFSNNISELNKVKKERNELQQSLLSIPKWIRSIFIK